ncbi:MAG: SLC13 family permease [Pseudomonadota bacterium]
MPHRPIRTTLAQVIGPLSGLLLCAVLMANEQSFATGATAGLTLWVAIWWVFEALPIPVTSLLPIALFPALGILTPQEVGQSVGSPLILLLMGGFILSRGMQRSGVHKRLAMALLSAFGGGPRAVVFGFLCTAALLSMWISNTATALMLLPIALAALGDTASRTLRVCVVLAVAYGCSIGSLGTPIGTTPNLVFMDAFREASGQEIGFVQFMKWGLPVVAVLLPLAGLVLTWGLPQTQLRATQQLGPWHSIEIRTLMVFGATALLWLTRREPFGGWSTWFGMPGANDASVALTAVVAMFLIPSGRERGDRLLDWDTARDIPWGILLLFGGGLCIARAFDRSGLSDLIGAQLAALIADWPLYLTMLLLALGVTFLTELTSNTATAALLMPILGGAAVAANMPPIVIMLPAAMSASCAFMLPVATGPNAVVFASGEVRILDMIRRGFALNLLGAVAVSGLVWSYQS